MKKSTKKKKNNKSNSLLDSNFKKIILGFSILLTIIYIFILGNNTGFIGEFLKSNIFKILGLGTYVFPIILIVNSILYLIDKLSKKRRNNFLFIYGIFIILLILLDLNMNSGQTLGARIDNSLLLSDKFLGAGIIGASITFSLLKSVGKIGIFLFIIIYLFISGIYIFNISISELYSDGKEMFSKFIEFTKKILSKLKKSEKDKLENDKNIVADEPIIKDKIKNIDEDVEVKEIVFNDYNNDGQTKTLDNIDIVEEKGMDLGEDDIEELEVPSFINEDVEQTPYIFPSLKLLHDPTGSNGDSKYYIIEKAQTIEATLSSFGIKSEVVEINKGPTVTCYELEPAPGIKVSKIVNLADDLAMSLASPDIRIEAPIPGKSVVGIEVPNTNKESVFLKEILESKEFSNNSSLIPIALGKSISGKAIVTSIDKMPHLLIAGATGSGKSVCINTIIMSIIYRANPEDVKLILIDPKVVELSVYNDIPHLAIPVVTNAKKANFALNWAVTEMERRYKIFSENYVRDISSYNKKNIDNSLEKLPYIVIIIDELSDLMMVAAGEVEESIGRLAQMARACGIHLIVATQRPSVDVITGTIKANIPSRISFAVSSQIDSRTILDISGAEKLLGRGDMLFFPSDISKPLRVQGAFISDSEVENVVDFLKDQNISNYDSEIIENIDNKQKASENFESTDKLFDEAVKIILEEDSASISLLQRKMKIGYARAGRIIDEMEEMGIVSGYEGSKPRKILVGKDYFNNMEE